MDQRPAVAEGVGNDLILERVLGDASEGGADLLGESLAEARFARFVVVLRPGDVAQREALVWAVGMPLIFLGMDLVPWTGQPLIAALAIYVGCATAGAIVGVIHGSILVQLLRGVSPARP